jgi:hypothetical protein
MIDYDLPLERQAKENYAAYVDRLRDRFAVRIQITDNGVSIAACEATRKSIIEYLELRLHYTEYAIQDNIGYVRLHSVWFKNREDAIACMLQFGGKAV